MLSEHRSGHGHTLLTPRQMYEAFAEGQFYLNYQPRFSLLSGKIASVEALIRWRHPVLGEIMPDHFIHIAEKSEFIVPLGEWVVLAACKQLLRWREMGLPRVGMAVNVSAKQFCQQRFVGLIEEAISSISSGEYFRDLELEITETCLMPYTQDVIARLNQLKRMDVMIAIDDFGTGYSGLSYLAHLPVDTLKIDKSFISDLGRSERAAIIVVAVIDLAHSLGLKVVAEGVENTDQLCFLNKYGCDYCQGFLLGKPLAPKQVAEMLGRQM